jgi:hypothetical protein
MEILIPLFVNLFSFGLSLIFMQQIKICHRAIKSGKEPRILYFIIYILSFPALFFVFSLFVYLLITLLIIPFFSHLLTYIL